MNKIDSIIATLGKIYGSTPMYQAFGHDAFQFLAAVMLSARSRDSVTIPTAQRIFAQTPTPETILKIDVGLLESLLRPIGFYRTKARYLKGLSSMILQEFGGRIPNNFDGLVRLPGVSRKVAHVVLSELFNQDVIAVDTHVHRISNRLGWVTTTKVEDTEKKLMSYLPRRFWRTINGQLVQHGQQICLPLTPRCSICPIKEWCPRVGVVKSS